MDRDSRVNPAKKKHKPLSADSLQRNPQPQAKSSVQGRPRPPVSTDSLPGPSKNAYHKNPSQSAAKLSTVASSSRIAAVPVNKPASKSAIPTSTSQRPPVSSKVLFDPIGRYRLAFPNTSATAHQQRAAAQSSSTSGRGIPSSSKSTSNQKPISSFTSTSKVGPIPVQTSAPRKLLSPDDDTSPFFTERSDSSSQNDSEEEDRDHSQSRQRDTEPRIDADDQKEPPESGFSNAHDEKALPESSDIPLRASYFCLSEEEEDDEEQKDESRPQRKIVLYNDDDEEDKDKDDSSAYKRVRWKARTLIATSPINTNDEEENKDEDEPPAYTRVPLRMRITIPSFSIREDDEEGDENEFSVDKRVRRRTRRLITPSPITADEEDLQYPVELNVVGVADDSEEEQGNERTTVLGVDSDEEDAQSAAGSAMEVADNSEEKDGQEGEGEEDEQEGEEVEVEVENAEELEPEHEQVQEENDVVNSNSDEDSLISDDAQDEDNDGAKTPSQESNGSPRKRIVKVVSNSNRDEDEKMEVDTTEVAPEPEPELSPARSTLPVAFSASNRSQAPSHALPDAPMDIAAQAPAPDPLHSSHPSSLSQGQPQPQPYLPAIVASIVRLEESIRAMRAEQDVKWEQERVERVERETLQAREIEQREAKRRAERERERAEAKEKERELELERLSEAEREKARQAEQNRLSRELEREKACQAEQERVARELEREKAHQDELGRKKARQDELERELKREREKARQVEEERDEERRQREEDKELERGKKLQHALEMQRERKRHAQELAANANAVPVPVPQVVIPPEMEDRIAKRIFEVLTPALSEMLQARFEAEKRVNKEEREREKAQEKAEDAHLRVDWERFREESQKVRDEQRERVWEERQQIRDEQRERAWAEREKVREAKEERGKEERVEVIKSMMWAWESEHREKERLRTEMEARRETERVVEREKMTRRDEERDAREKTRFEGFEKKVDEHDVQRQEERDLQKVRDEKRDKDVQNVGRALGILADRVGVVLNALGVRLDGKFIGSGATATGTAALPEDTSFAAIGKKRRRLARGEAQDVEVEVIDVDMEETWPSASSSTSRPYAEKPEVKSVMDRLTNVEMDLQECLERLRDPMAGLSNDVQALVQTGAVAQTQNQESLNDPGSTFIPGSGVRSTRITHEMGTSPLKPEDVDTPTTRKRKLTLEDDIEEALANGPSVQTMTQQEQNDKIMERIDGLSQLIFNNAQIFQAQNLELNTKITTVMEHMGSITSRIAIRKPPKAQTKAASKKQGYDGNMSQDEDELPVEEPAEDDVFGPLIANSSPFGTHGPLQASPRDTPDRGAAENSATPGDALTPEAGAGSSSAKGEERAPELERDADVVMDDVVPVEAASNTNDARVGFQDENTTVDITVDEVKKVVREEKTTIVTSYPRASSSSVSRPGSHSRSKSSTGQFSPVDWSRTTRTETKDGSVVLNLSPNAKLILGPPSTSPPQRSAPIPLSNPNTNPSALQMLATSLSAGGKTIATMPPLAMAATKSYTLPPPMEGSIAALREVSLGTAYTDAYVYGEALNRDRSFGVRSEGDRREGLVDMVMGAEAGERMLSPQSEDEDEEDDDEENEEDEEDEDDDDEQRDELMDDGQEDEAIQGLKSAGLASGVASISLAGPSTAETVMKEKTVSNASTLSALTSLTSSPAPSSKLTSIAEPTPEVEMPILPTPSVRTESVSSAPSPVIDLAAAKFGPPRKKSTLQPVTTVQPSNSAATLSVSHTASTATLSTSTTVTTPFPDSQKSQTTEEDEAAVHNLVMMGSQESQIPEEMDDAYADDAMATTLAMYADEDEQEQEPTPVPETSLKIGHDETVPSSYSPPTVDKGKGRATDMQSGMGDVPSAGPLSPLFTTPSQTPGRDVPSTGPSSPLFTSPSQIQGLEHDPSFNGDDDEMDTSTPVRIESKPAAVNSKADFDDEYSETAKIVQAKKELNSPITVPAALGKEYGYIPSESPSPNRIVKSAKSTAKAVSKASTSKAQASNEIVEIDSDDPQPTSFVRTPVKPKKKTSTKVKGERPSASQPPDDVISISSGSENEVKEVKPTQTQTQKKSTTLSQTSSTQKKRPRPIPDARRRSSAAKLDIFPDRSPEVVDLTTPVKDSPAAAASSRPRVQASQPLSPLASTSMAAPVNLKKPVQSLKPPAPTVQEKPAAQKPVSAKGKGKEAAAAPAPEPAPEERFSSPLTSEDESEAEKTVPPVRSPFDIAKATARITNMDDDSDEDIPIIKKKKISLRPPPSFASGSFDSGGAGATAGPNVGNVMGTSGGAPKTMAELLAAKGKNRSLAATRVRKRKRPEASLAPSAEDASAGADGETDRNQPPLKRARARSAATTTSITSISTTEKGKPRETRRESLRSKEVAIKEEGPSTRYSLRSPRKDLSVGSSSASFTTTPKRKPGQNVVWPRMMSPNFDRFVKCDECETWYHIGCVGLEPDDIRLQDTELYICPMCAAGVPKEKSPVKKINDEEVNGLKAPCARPRCLLTYVNRRAKNKNPQPLLEEPQLYLVEALVGRHKKVTGGQGISYEYLVKWQGYNYAEATVENLDSMGMSNPGPLLEAFEKQAVAEGIDLDASDTVLLREAAEAGWNDDLVFVKRE